jgi:hypothetical protein
MIKTFLSFIKRSGFPKPHSILVVFHGSVKQSRAAKESLLTPVARTGSITQTVNPAAIVCQQRRMRLGHRAPLAARGVLHPVTAAPLRKQTLEFLWRN